MPDNQTLLSALLRELSAGAQGSEPTQEKDYLHYGFAPLPSTAHQIVDADADVAADPKQEALLQKRDDLLRARMDQEALLRQRDELLRQHMAAEQEALLARRDALLARQRTQQAAQLSGEADQAAQIAANRPALDINGNPIVPSARVAADRVHGRHQQLSQDDILRFAHQAQAAGAGAQTRPTAPADPDVQAAAAALIQPAANYAMTAPTEYVPPHLQAMRAAREAVNRAMLTTLPRPVAEGLQGFPGAPAFGSAMGYDSLRNQ